VTRGVVGPSIDRRIFALAIPALGALAADPLLSLVDTAFVARLGPEPLAALGVNGAIFGFAFVLFNFLAYVTTPLVARAMGAGRRDEATEIIVRALGLGALLGLGASLFLAGFASPLLQIMQTGPDVREPALAYLQTRAWAAPAVLITLAAHGGFRGLADTRTPLFIALLVNLVNVGLVALFLFVFGWGVAGAALASVIAQYLGAGLLLKRLLHRTGRLPLAVFRWSRMTELLRPGAWITVRTLLLVGALAVATAAAARIGTSALAAHQVVRETWFLTAMLVDGLAIAAQALVAEAGGKGDAGGEAALIRRFLFWGLVVGGILTVAWLFAAEPLAFAFAPNKAVADQIGAATPMLAAFAIPASWLWVLDGIVLGQLRIRRMALSTAVGAVLGLGVLALVVSGDASLSGVWLAIGVLVLGRLGVLVWGGLQRPALGLG
jgi:MATE family multidrug resistance protein